MLPYACNLSSIGCDFTRCGDRWGIKIEYPLGYANSGDSLFCDTGEEQIPVTFGGHRSRSQQATPPLLVL